MSDPCASKREDCETREYESEEEDIYVQLARKDQDLILAAELGKALLEKNQELEERNALVAEEYAKKIEELEQEKYALQMQLTQRQTEYENTVKDLQEDVGALHDQLSHRDFKNSVGYRQHVHDMNQLQQHNEALSEQLRQSVTLQDNLSSELHQLRSQMKSHRSSVTSQINHLDQLEDEIQRLQKRQHELETRIHELSKERDTLLSELEESQERVLLLEKQRREQDELLHRQHYEIQELQETNTLLQSQVDRLTSQNYDNVDTSQTLFSELSHHSDSSSATGPSIDQEHNLDRVISLSAEMLDEGDFEYDDDDIFTAGVVGSSSFLSDCHTPSLHTELNNFKLDSCHNQQVNNETSSMTDIEEDYPTTEWSSDDCQLRTSSVNQICQVSSSSVDERRERRFKQRISLTSELKALMLEMTANPEEASTQRDDRQKMDATSESDKSGQMYLKGLDWQMADLHQELAGTCGQLFSIRERMEQRDMQLKRNSVEFFELAAIVQLQDCQSRLVKLQEERDHFQDAVSGQLTVSKILQQTRTERDEAIERVHQLELVLARSRSDVVMLNAQLMAAIQQKVALSEELDQWQMDLAELLKIQMSCRIREQYQVEQTVGVLEKKVETSKAQKSSFFKLKKL